MEWANILRIASETGGNIGSVYLICYTIVEVVKIIALSILGYEIIKSLFRLCK